MYRPEIKVLDCTIRDGGLMNNWYFSDEFVTAVYRALSAAGVDYMEMGYMSSESAFSRDENGPWKFCRDEDIRRVVGDEPSEMKLSAMVDIGRIEYENIPPKSESLLSMIRVACYIHQMDAAIAIAEHCIDKGYEVTINLMAVSKVMERDVDEALDVRGRVGRGYGFGGLVVVVGRAPGEEEAGKQQGGDQEMEPAGRDHRNSLHPGGSRKRARQLLHDIRFWAARNGLPAPASSREGGIGDCPGRDFGFQISDFSQKRSR